MLGNNVMLNEKRVSEIVGMSVAWLRKQRYSGQGIPSMKVGRSVRYRKDDVDAWINMLAETAA